MKYTVGIDEVGRGPIAGPVTVCAIQWLSDESPEKVLEGIKDSKKLTEKKRKEWVSFADKIEDKVRFYIHSVPASDIDSIGISAALLRASSEVLKSLDGKQKIEHVYSDYGLPLPDTYLSTHIIKGDEKNPLIALASILAKVSRDDFMAKISDEFSLYALERNKGYGTKEHMEAVKKHGPSSIHRVSFLKNIL